MTWHRTEQEVDEMIEQMKKRSKGKYITQGVSFNKTCPRQMEMLKRALMSSASFSGLAKELLAVKFSGGASNLAPSTPISSQSTPMEAPKVKNVGNFL
jgi:hypothetical protein